MKFKVGDKVFDVRKINIWNNTYHHKEFLNNMIVIVKYANERWFSTGCEHLDYTSAMDAWEVNSQITGLPKYGTRKLLHLIHDKDEIMSILNKTTTEGHNKALQNKQNIIKKAENDLILAKEKLEKLKSELETKEQLFNRMCHNAIIVKLQNENNTI